jgi:hypothetical protein
VASSRRRAGAARATIGTARVGQGLGPRQLAPSSREERRSGRRRAPTWPRQWATELGNGRSGGVVAGRQGPEEVAARDVDGGPGVGDPRRWRPETSTVAWRRG